MAVMATHATEATGDRVAWADAAVVGRIAIPGRTEQVRMARAFVARVLGGLAAGPRAAAAECAGRERTGAERTAADDGTLDDAVLLTSELVTNAIQHSRSGAPDGLVMLRIMRAGDDIRVEVTDSGSARGAPVVRDDVYTCDGHGLFLVEAVAGQWGYRSPDGTATTVWFQLSLSSTGTTAGRR
jgi:anti-sigma regulatory factor (Ser/Thr protein kinase)